jgi:hypothetical protein
VRGEKTQAFKDVLIDELHRWERTNYDKATPVGKARTRVVNVMLRKILDTANTHKLGIHQMGSVINLVKSELEHLQLKMREINRD